MNSNPQNSIIHRSKHGFQCGRHWNRLLGFLASLVCTVVLSSSVKAASFVPVSSSLKQESCPNGYFDPGETTSVQFVIKNDSGGNLEEVQVELLADGADLGGGTVVTGSNID